MLRNSIRKNYKLFLLNSNYLKPSYSTLSNFNYYYSFNFNPTEPNEKTNLHHSSIYNSNFFFNKRFESTVIHFNFNS